MYGLEMRIEFNRRENLRSTEGKTLSQKNTELTPTKLISLQALKK